MIPITSALQPVIIMGKALLAGYVIALLVGFIKSLKG